MWDFPPLCRLVRTPENPGWLHITTPTGRWMASFIEGVVRVMPTGHPDALADVLGFAPAA